MDIDIRQITSGGWESSQINVKVNGRWRYFYTPENSKPVNSKEPIQYGAGYKPPAPSKYFAQLSKKQFLKRPQAIDHQYIETSRTESSLGQDPYIGLSTFSTPQRDKIHPVRQKFLLDSVKKRPKAPYTFYTNATNNCESKSINSHISTSTNPPAMSNENYQLIHEQNQKLPKIRRRSHSQNQPQNPNNKSELDDSNLYQFQDCSTSARIPNETESQISQNEISARTQQEKLNSIADSKKYRRFLRPSIGVSKPLLKFKCMVRPNNHTLYLGNENPVDMPIDNKLPPETKRLINQIIEERKRQNEEPENEDNIEDLLGYNQNFPGF